MAAGVPALAWPIHTPTTQSSPPPSPLAWLRVRGRSMLPMLELCVTGMPSLDAGENRRELPQSDSRIGAQGVAQPWRRPWQCLTTTRQVVAPLPRPQLFAPPPGQT